MAADLFTFEDADIPAIDLFDLVQAEPDEIGFFEFSSVSEPDLVTASVHENFLFMELDANATGNAVVEIAMYDSNGNWQSMLSYEIEVAPVNDTPFTVGLPALELTEGETDKYGTVVDANIGSIDLADYFRDLETDVANLQFGFHGSETSPQFNSRSRFGNPVDRVEIIGSELFVTPSTEFFGFAELPVFATDTGQGEDNPRTVSTTLWILVDEYNDEPLVVDGGHWTLDRHVEGTPPGMEHVMSDRTSVVDLRRYFNDEEDKGYLTYHASVDHYTSQVFPDPDSPSSIPYLVEPHVKDEVNDVLLYEVNYDFKGRIETRVNLYATDHEGKISEVKTLFLNIDVLRTGNKYSSCDEDPGRDCAVGSDPGVGDPEASAELDLQYHITDVSEDREDSPGTHVAENNDFTEDNWEKQTTRIAGGLVTGYDSADNPIYGFEIEQMVEVRDNQLDRGLSEFALFHDDNFLEYDWTHEHVDTDRDLRTFTATVDFDIDQLIDHSMYRNWTVGWEGLTFDLEYDESVMNLWMQAAYVYSPAAAPSTVRPMIIDHLHDDGFGGHDLSYLFQDGAFEIVNGEMLGLEQLGRLGARFVVEGMDESTSDITGTMHGFIWWRNNSTGEVFKKPVGSSSQGSIDELTTHISKVEIDLPETQGGQLLYVPDRSEQINQHRPSVIAINARDDDMDGILDVFDGFDMDQETTDPDLDLRSQATEAGFVPITIHLSDSIDINKAFFRIQYAESDPLRATIDDDGIRTRPGSGLRIWKLDKGEIRDPHIANLVDPIPDDDEVLEPGDYIGSNFGSAYHNLDLEEVRANSLEGYVGEEYFYTWAQLGGSSGSQTVTLYLEGVHPGRYSVGISVDPDGFNVNANPGGGTDPGTDPGSGTDVPGDPPGGPGGGDPPGGDDPVLDPDDLFIGFGLIDKFYVNVVQELSVSAPNSIGSEPVGVSGLEDLATFAINRGIGNTHQFTNTNLIPLQSPNAIEAMDVYYQLVFPEDQVAFADDPLTTGDASDYYILDSEGNRVSLALEDNTWWGKASFEQGRSQIEITIYNNDDEVVEWDESITIKLQPFAAYRLSHMQINSEDSRLDEDSTREWIEENDLNRAIPNDGIVGGQQFYHVKPFDPHRDTRSAQVTLHDNDEMQATRLRNVDTETTGEVISSNTNNPFFAANVIDGAIELMLFAGSRVGNYSANDNLVPLLTFESRIPFLNHEFAQQSDLPKALAGILSVAGIEGPEMSFNITREMLESVFVHGSDPGWGQYSPFRTLKFVVVGPEDLVNHAPSGSYDYDLRLMSTFEDSNNAAEDVVVERTMRGRTEVINRVNNDFGWSEFGSRWWVQELHRITADDGATLPGGTNESVKIPGQKWNSQTREWDEVSNSSASRVGRLGALTESTFSLIRGDNTSTHYFIDPNLQSTQIVHVDDEHQNSSTTAFSMDDQVWQPGDWVFENENQNSVNNDPKRILHWYSAGGLNDRDDVFTWDFANLQPGKPVQVFVNFQAGDDRAANAQYLVEGAQSFSSGVEEKVIYVDQRFSPGELEHEGLMWRSLGFFVPVSTVIKVHLHTKADDEAADGYVVAGSAMVVSNWDVKSKEDGSFTELTVGKEYFPHGPNSQTGNAGNFFGIETKYQSRYEFNEHGVLTAGQDRNRNRIEYAYQDSDDDGLSDEIHTINDQGGLVSTYNFRGIPFAALGYDLTDAVGRVTSVDFVGDTVDKVRLPAVNHANSQDIVYDFTQGPGVTRPLTHIVTSLGTTKIEYGETARPESAIRVTNPDGYAWTFVSELSVPDHVYQPGSGRILSTEQGDASAINETRATYTDGRENIWFYQTDNYGLQTAFVAPPTLSTNKHESKWTQERNRHGLVTRSVEPEGGLGIYEDGTDRVLPELETTFEYFEDSQFDLKNVTYADGTFESWTYHNLFHQIVSHTDQKNYQRSYVRDGYGNTELAIEPIGYHLDAGRDTEFEYTTAPASIWAMPGGMVEVTRIALATSDEVTVRNIYTPHGIQIGLIEKTIYAEGEPEEISNRFEYNAKRQLTHSYSPTGRETEYVNDDLGQVVRIIEPHPDTGPFQPITDIYFDGSGNQIKIQDPMFNITETEYDGMNRVRFVTSPEPGGEFGTPEISLIREQQYDANGNIAFELTHLDGNKQETSADRKTEHQYDRRNLLVKSISPDPKQTDNQAPDASKVQPIVQFRYDVHGNIDRHTDPRDGGLEDAFGNATTYRYDEMHRQSKETLPAGIQNHSIVLTYSEPISIFSYDELGRLTKTKTRVNEDLWAELETEYDAWSRVHKQLAPEDHNGNRANTIHKYDRRDNVKESRTTAVGPESTKILLTEYDYDKNDRLLFIDHPDSSGGSLYSAFAYTADGDQVRSWTSTIGPLTAETDYELRVEDFDDDYVDWQDVFKIRYVSNVLDGLGRVVERTDIDPDGSGVKDAVISEFEYDLNDNLIETTVIGDETNVTTTYYDELDRAYHQFGTEAGNGTRPETKTTYNVDGSVREVEIKNVDHNGNETWQSNILEYDNLGRLIISKNEYLEGTSNFSINKTFMDAGGNLIHTVDENGLEMDFAYDHNNRRIQMTEPVVHGLDNSDMSEMKSIYVYHANGQIHFQSKTTDATYSQYDAVGHLIYRRSQGSGGSIENDYRYDGLGNRISSESKLNGTATSTRTEFEFDAHGNLTSENQSNLPAKSFAYDAFGNRITETDGNGNVIKSIYDTAGRKTRETWFGNDNVEDYRSEFDHNSFGELVSATDPNSAYFLQYDKQGRIKQFGSKLTLGGTGFTSPATTFTYEYDLTGNILTGSFGAQFNQRQKLSVAEEYQTDLLGRTTKYWQAIEGVHAKGVTYRFEGSRLDHTTYLESPGTTGAIPLGSIDTIASSTLYYNNDGRLESQAGSFKSPQTGMDQTFWVTDQRYDNLGRLIRKNSQWIDRYDTNQTPGQFIWKEDNNNFQPSSFFSQIKRVEGHGRDTLPDGVLAWEFDDNGNLVKLVSEDIARFNTNFTSSGWNFWAGSDGTFSIGVDKILPGDYQFDVKAFPQYAANNWSYRPTDGQVYIVLKEGENGARIESERIDPAANGPEWKFNIDLNEVIENPTLEIWHIKPGHNEPGTQIFNLEGEISFNHIEVYSFEYDQRNRLTQIQRHDFLENIDPAVDGIAAATGELNSQIQYKHDVYGRVIKATHWYGGVDPNDSKGDESLVFVYDLFGNKTLTYSDPTGKGTLKLASIGFHDRSGNLNNVQEIYTITKSPLRGAVAEVTGKSHWLFYDQTGKLQFTLTDPQDITNSDTYMPEKVLFSTGGQNVFAPPIIRAMGVGFKNYHYDKFSGFHFLGTAVLGTEIGRFLQPNNSGTVTGKMDLYEKHGNSPNGTLDPATLNNLASSNDLILTGEPEAGLFKWFNGNNGVVDKFAQSIFNEYPGLASSISGMSDEAVAATEGVVIVGSVGVAFGAVLAAPIVGGALAGGSAIGATAGAVDGVLNNIIANPEASMLSNIGAAFVGGGFGALFPPGAIGSLGGGIAGYAGTGGQGYGYQVGSLAGGIASGGLAAYGKASGTVAQRLGYAIRRPLAEMAGGGAAGGAAYFSSGGDWNSALMAANFGAMGSGIVAGRFKFFQCFVAGTPVLVPAGNSESQTEVAAMLAAVSESNEASGLDIRKVSGYAIITTGVAGWALAQRMAMKKIAEKHKGIDMTWLDGLVSNPSLRRRDMLPGLLALPRSAWPGGTN